MTSSYNYKTYYLGTPKDIENSRVLVLLRSSDMFDVSLETLNTTLPDKIEANKNLVKKAWKDDEEGVFILRINGDIFDFDTILYYNPVSGYVGYTVFSGLQHCYSSAGIPFEKLKISLVFERIEGEGNGVFLELQTFLDPNTENTEILGETERYQYQKSETIYPISSEETYLKFTNRVSDFKGDKNLTILTDSGITTHTGSFGMYILSGVEVDYESFSFIKPVLYKGDISVLKYSSQTGEYCVSSLSTLNAFGRPYDYISGVVMDSYPDFIDYTGQMILFGDQDNYYVYSLKTSESTPYPKRSNGIRNYIIMDKWDPDGEIRFTPESDLKKEISIHTNIPPAFDDIQYTYQKKQGDWWIFQGPSGYVYLSVGGTIYSDVEIGFINSRLGVYIEPTKKGIYHFLPIDIGHTYEYREKEKRFLDKTIGDYVDILVNPSDSLSSLSGDLRCLLDGLRRKPLRTRGCLPQNNLLGLGMGMIFYLSEGLLYCY